MFQFQAECAAAKPWGLTTWRLKKKDECLLHFRVASHRKIGYYLSAIFGPKSREG
jgi:hypothetical protein